MKATALPVLSVCASITSRLNWPASMASLSRTAFVMTGMIVASCLRPITDNAGGTRNGGSAGGIRNITDPLDAVGNTPRRSPRAIASVRRAGRAGAVRRYTMAWGLGPASTCPTIKSSSACSGRLGAVLFGALAMEAVGRAPAASSPRCAASSKKSRHHGLHASGLFPRVDMLTKAAIREMIVPSLLPSACRFQLLGAGKKL